METYCGWILTDGDLHRPPAGAGSPVCWAWGCGSFKSVAYWKVTSQVRMLPSGGMNAVLGYLVIQRASWPQLVPASGLLSDFCHRCSCRGDACYEVPIKGQHWRLNKRTYLCEISTIRYFVTTENRNSRNGYTSVTWEVQIALSWHRITTDVTFVSGGA